MQSLPLHIVHKTLDKTELWIGLRTLRVTQLPFPLTESIVNDFLEMPLNS